MTRWPYTSILAALAAASARAAEVTIPVADYGTGGWVHSIVPWDGVPGFEAPAFDDSAWSKAAAPFGTGCYCGVGFSTFWPPGTDLLVRRWIDVPVNGRVRVGAQIDNEVQAFVGGSAISPPVSTVGCSAAERYTAVSPVQADGATLVAIRARDLGGCSHLDIRIEVVFDADCNGDGAVDYAQIASGALADVNRNNIPDSCESGGFPPVHWVDWISSSATTATGSADGIGVVYTGGLNFVQVDGGVNYFLPAGPYVSDTVPNAPSLPDIVSLAETAGTLTFSEPVEDPEMAIVSLGHPWNATDWAFSEPFEILSQGPGHFGNGPLSNPGGNVLRGQEGHGTIRFHGILTEISWTIVQGENWAGFTVAARRRSCPADLDGSGVINANDLALILGSWGTDGGKTPEADLNRDGTVNADDLSVVLGSWGACP